jgi:threonine dehydrogenase-like Zn-dependent dehydrogenase
MYVEDQASIPIGDMWLKNINLVAGVANIQGHMDELLELVRARRIDPKAIISHRLPLSQGPEGYELFDSKQALKVVLDPKA